MQISDWFKKQDYKIGVSIYTAHPDSKIRTVKLLQKGRTDRTMSLLIKELRTFNNARHDAPKKKLEVNKPVKVSKPVPRTEEGLKTAKSVELKDASASSFFKKIKYGDLPPELKMRFRKLKDLYYDILDLDHQLKDLPDEMEEEALSLMLQIDAMDDQKDTIWKELEHWQLYKTLLPTKTTEDFTDLDPLALDLKMRNFKSQISKKKSRIRKWEKAAELCKDKLEQRKVLQQINRTGQDLHQDEINLRKVQKLLTEAVNNKDKPSS